MRKPTLGVFLQVFSVLAASSNPDGTNRAEAEARRVGDSNRNGGSRDIQIPAEFRFFAVYERLVDQVRASNVSKRYIALAIAPPMAFPIWSRCTPRWRRTKKAAKPSGS